MNITEKQNRNTFLKNLGFGGASLFALYTLEACSTDEVSAAGVEFDLTASANANLKTNGGYVIKSNVVVANHNGNYIAATLICSHEDLKEMVFRNGQWFCTEHDAIFDLTGKGLNKNGSKGLTIYKTSLNGNILTVTK